MQRNERNCHSVSFFHSPISFKRYADGFGVTLGKQSREVNFRLSNYIHHLPFLSHLIASVVIWCSTEKTHALLIEDKTTNVLDYYFEDTHNNILYHLRGRKNNALVAVIRKIGAGECGAEFTDFIYQDWENVFFHPDSMIFNAPEFLTVYRDFKKTDSEYNKEFEDCLLNFINTYINNHSTRASLSFILGCLALLMLMFFAYLIMQSLFKNNAPSPAIRILAKPLRDEEIRITSRFKDIDPHGTLTPPVICGITHEPPDNPVTTDDGQIYDYDALMAWIKASKEPHCPSNMQQRITYVVPVLGVKALLHAFLDNAAIQKERENQMTLRL